MTTNSNLQEIKSDNGKAKLSLVPTQIMYDIARIREYGCNKYPRSGEYGWKLVEVERYIDAMLRHAMQFSEEPTGVDSESGLPHLWHLACNVSFLCELLKEEFNATSK